MERTKITIRSTFPKYMLIEMCRAPQVNNDRRRKKKYYVLYDVTELAFFLRSEQYIPSIISLQLWRYRSPSGRFQLKNRIIPPMTRPPRDLTAGIAVQVIRGLDWIKTTRTMSLQIPVTVSFLLVLVLLILAVRTPHADYYALCLFRDVYQQFRRLLGPHSQNNWSAGNRKHDVFGLEAGSLCCYLHS